MDGRHPLSNSATAVLFLLAGAAAVAFAVWMAGFSVPEQLADDRAYRSAPACPQPAGTARTARTAGTARTDDCVREREFTVSDVRTGRREYGATLTDSAGTARRIGFAGAGPLLHRLRDGDRVTATLWRGAVQEIAAKGTRQETWARPVNPAGANLAAAAGVGTAGLVLAAACGLRLRQGADRYEPTRRMRLLVRLAAGLGAAGVAAAVFTAWLGLGLWTGPALWALCAAPMTAVFVRAWRRAPALPPEPWTPTPL
ncbi:hypothetical protein [Streptomyces caatingaensis]|uniref:hypothetical protein n=1 Tax=Streptomyces caatingaensis TaxID=1678637 RepID=UPI00067282C7|nr:hypothetical protein [Streptomyces caatingaensis]